jgi:hypothetical protein
MSLPFTLAALTIPVSLDFFMAFGSRIFLISNYLGFLCRFGTGAQLSKHFKSAQLAQATAMDAKHNDSKSPQHILCDRQDHHAV